ncbi:MAG: diaminopimelate epimerase [Gammaproteobacteria bacterium]|nr:diaminopimelate epimerase [Gammaproteobacteria bacterium]
MKLKFTKMQGLGNDFIVIDGISQSLDLQPQQVRALADRHLGIGCDQLLLIEPARTPQADFSYRIFNGDGGEVEQCGNGVRCFARYVWDKGLSKKQNLVIETRAGILKPRIESDGQISVDMGPPSFEPRAIPFSAPIANTYKLPVGDTSVELSALAIGNPHAVIQVDNVDEAPVDTLGPAIESHSSFPQRVNVGFMQIVDPGHIRLRVYERGVGETQACGSGACAAVVAGIRRKLLAPRVEVELTGGALVIEWPGEPYPVLMTGPATTVFEGEIEL